MARFHKAAPQLQLPLGRLPGGLQLWLGIAVSAYVGLSLLFIGHTADDSFISLRYARNLVEGHGLVWNPGESVPVEGYSNLLWVLMMAAFLKLAPDQAMLLTQIVGLASGLGCIFLTARLARAWGAEPLGQALAALMIGLAPTFAFWAVSGMETATFGVALLGAMLLLRTRRPWYPAAMAVAALLRPEGGYLFAILWIWRLGVDLVEGARRPALLSALRDGLVFSTLHIPFLAWRYVHYGSLAPNSVHAKFQLWGGLRFLVLDALQYFPAQFAAAMAVAAVAGLAAGPRRDRLPLFLLPVAVTLSLINCRPAMGYYFRFFWPVLPLVFIACSLTLEAVWRRYGRWMAAGIAAALLIYPFIGLGAILSTARSQAAITRAVLQPLAERVRQNQTPGTLLALSDCGFVPYVSRAQVLDLWGLNDIEIARDGFNVRRVVARSPRYVALVSRSAQQFDPLFSWEGALAQDPLFRERYRLAQVYSAPAPIEYHSWLFERIEK